MTQSGLHRSEPPFIRGVEPLPTVTKPLDAGALAMEHVLASLARMEARLDATDRGVPTTVPPLRPDPVLPSGVLQQLPVYTQATGVSLPGPSRPLMEDSWASGSKGSLQQPLQTWGNTYSDPCRAQPPNPSHSLGRVTWTGQ